jgi:type I restriction enzyme, R subunit
LIAVSKLLTGFDAPSCTYIYLDNELHEHNLFQAICRTNRLDGDDKDYGYIVDFKELLGDVQEAIAVYSSDELDADEGSGGDNNVRLKDWLVDGKKQLDAAREALRYLCDPVPPSREMEQYLRYFCGDASNSNALAETEPLRVSFYKAVATFVRAYADIAPNLIEAGYSDAEVTALQKEVEFYTDTRAAIKKHSGEELDIKPYREVTRHQEIGSKANLYWRRRMAARQWRLSGARRMMTNNSLSAQLPKGRHTAYTSKIREDPKNHWT